MDLLKVVLLVLLAAGLLLLVVPRPQDQESSLPTAQLVVTTGSGAFYRYATGTWIEYRTMYRYIEHYTWEDVEFRGQILQVISPSEFRVGTAKSTPSSSKYYEDVVYVSGYSGTRLLEGDLVTVRGTVRGPITYKTVLGASITLPWVECVSISLRYY